MSGIVAYLDRAGGLDRTTPTAMLERLDHRGPDGSGLWVDECIAIGHQDHKTTPEARYDEQPLADGEFIVALDGRIDNRPTLLKRLSVAGYPSQVPDSSLLRRAYQEWGTACLNHLVGSFAFVIWDVDAETVFCARDHMGVKPLYYYLDEDVFALASEAKALLEIPTVDRRLNEIKVGDFLTRTFSDKTNTFYTDIHRLPPAHAQSVTAETDRLWQYWDLDPTRTITLESDAAYERRFRELFEQAVRCRLRSNGAVGTDLSGGLDSSSVTVMARAVLPSEQPLHTFSNVFDEATASDEREFIETVATRPGIKPEYIFLDDSSAMVDCDRWLPYFDEPPHNTIHFGDWESAKRADGVGVDVVLSGGLGDSAVDYGLGLLPQLFRTGRWRLLYRELQAMGRINGASTRQVFTHHVLNPLVPESVTDWTDQLRGRPVFEARQNPALNPEFVNRIGLRSRYRTLRPTGSVRKRSGRRWQRRSLLSGQATATFETADQIGALFGVEPRHPFTDKRLIEFSLAIPSTQQLKDGWTRSIIRRSMDGLLPGKIQWRPWKTSMSHGFWNALSNEDYRLRALVQNSESLTPYLDSSALKMSYDRFCENPGSQDARILWQALSLGTWLDTRAVNH